ncbi:MAG: chromosomal replication initiator protein DnaA, partial [Actinobacteria bacterium]|nr:chromosomal replication initiator protein DnaA [Actinomycetota bacterium]
MWHEAKKHLRGRLNESAFQFWFDRTVPLGLDGGAFVIGVPNDFAREWIEKRLAGQVAAALADVLGDSVEVKVV